MEQNQINLSQMSDIQLKALAYDELSKAEMAQSNLRIINQELNNRVKNSSTTTNPNGITATREVIK